MLQGKMSDKANDKPVVPFFHQAPVVHNHHIPSCKVDQTP